MSALPFIPLQVAVRSILKASTALTSKLSGGPNGILDAVPDEKPFDFVTFGDIVPVEADTHTWFGFTIDMTIDTWSRAVSTGVRGKERPAAIMNEIYRLLHDCYPTVEGYEVMGFRQEMSNILVDPDGVTYHGIQRFKILLSEVRE